MAVSFQLIPDGVAISSGLTPDVSGRTGVSAKPSTDQAAVSSGERSRIEDDARERRFADARCRRPIPEVSGLCFTYDISSPVGSRVLSAVQKAANGSCSGPPIDLTAGGSYKIAENDFMTAGGDGYPVFTSRATTEHIMDQVLADCVQANSPVPPAIQGRIVCTTSGPTACPVVTP